MLTGEEWESKELGQIYESDTWNAKKSRHSCKSALEVEFFGFFWSEVLKLNLQGRIIFQTIWLFSFRF